MEQIKYSGFPSLLGDLDAQQEEINEALKRTWLMLGGIILPCVALVTFVLLSSGQ
ncbi:MAG: hypothetical protein RLZZ298_3495 [Pseudomonadota bacterium]|jgi:hypothetical protein